MSLSWRYCLIGWLEPISSGLHDANTASLAEPVLIGTEISTSAADRIATYLFTFDNDFWLRANWPQFKQLKTSTLKTANLDRGITITMSEAQTDKTHSAFNRRRGKFDLRHKAIFNAIYVISQFHFHWLLVHESSEIGWQVQPCNLQLNQIQCVCHCKKSKAKAYQNKTAWGQRIARHVFCHPQT